MNRVEDDKSRFVTLASEIVSAYVSNNHVQSADLPKLLNDIIHARSGASASGPGGRGPEQAERAGDPAFGGRPTS